MNDPYVPCCIDYLQNGLIGLNAYRHEKIISFLRNWHTTLIALIRDIYEEFLRKELMLYGWSWISIWKKYFLSLEIKGFEPWEKIGKTSFIDNWFYISLGFKPLKISNFISNFTFTSSLIWRFPKHFPKHK